MFDLGVGGFTKQHGDKQTKKIVMGVFICHINGHGTAHK
jgi:hypothetical protein